MLGLDYGSSSDEAEVVQPKKQQQVISTRLQGRIATNCNNAREPNQDTPGHEPTAQLSVTQTPQDHPGKSDASESRAKAAEISRKRSHSPAKEGLRDDHRLAEAPIAGPTAGPAAGPVEGPAGQSPEESQSSDVAAAQSPYSVERRRIHELTYPLDGNRTIPPSPPGSPPPGATAKFEKWLANKQTGLHYNAKLASSAAFRNSGYLQESLKALGLTQEDEYASTLPPELGVPAVFPDYAYATSLEQSRLEIQKQRDMEKKYRTAVDFVPGGQQTVPERSLGRR